MTQNIYYWLIIIGRYNLQKMNVSFQSFCFPLHDVNYFISYMDYYNIFGGFL